MDSTTRKHRVAICRRCGITYHPKGSYGKSHPPKFCTQRCGQLGEPNEVVYQDDTVVAIALTQGKIALIDRRDYPEIGRHRWSAAHRDLNWYASRSIRNSEGELHAIYMHRAIMQTPVGVEIDHVNGDGLHNTRDNLRVCTHGNNTCNTGLRADNSSGFKGVYRVKKTGRFAACVRLNGRNLYQGGYATAEEAARAYDAAAREHFGKFARLNFPLQYANPVAHGERVNCGRAGAPLYDKK